MELFLYCIAVAVVAAAIAVVATLIAQRKMAGTRAKLIIEDAYREAEDIKRNKALEGREEALKISAEAEKAANARIAKIQSAEAKQKQRELQLNQQQSENQRAKNENEATR
ncbi:MAG: Rnase Y domain-containing protein, partial [Muribaculaceae bacterium]|nr:Rnase Y domain-containing protein [Muribaculaceae bacterium]